MDRDPAVPRWLKDTFVVTSRCLPQRPRIGGWKKNAKGLVAGDVLVAMICLD